MSDSNAVTMNIPENNPLFEWVTNLNQTGPIPYVNVSVGDVSARLQLIEAPAIHFPLNEYSNGDDVHTIPRRCYLETSWRLLRDNT